MDRRLAPGPAPGGDLFRDVVIDANTVEHSAVGIQIGPNVGGVVLSRNHFPTWPSPCGWPGRQGVLDLGTEGVNDEEPERRIAMNACG